MNSELTLENIDEFIENVRTAGEWYREFVVLGSKEAIDAVSPYLDLRYGTTKICEGLEKDKIYIIPDRAPSPTIEKIDINQVFDAVYEAFMQPYRIVETDNEN